jgi:lipoprotein-releasing system permease protein
MPEEAREDTARPISKSKSKFQEFLTRIPPIFLFAARRSSFKKRSAHRSGLLFAALGIAAGVVALIVVLSVMNGLQSQYIDSILETTSFHVRIVQDESLDRNFENLLRQNSRVRSVTPFSEANVLASSPSHLQNIVRIMWLDPLALEKDIGFCQTIHISTTSAAERLSSGILIGSEVARSLGVTEGSKLTLRGAYLDPLEGLQQYSFEGLISGIFKSGYYEIDSSLVIASLGQNQVDAQKILPSILGIKLKNPNNAEEFIHKLSLEKPDILKNAESWQEFNRSFFSALRTEKYIMFLLVSIIFAVVAINIHYAMRRSISYKSKDLAILAAFGMHQQDISAIFTIEGALVGIFGTLVGVSVGIPVARNVDGIINFIISVIDSLLSIFVHLGLIKSLPDLRIFSPSVFYIEGLPSKIIVSDIFVISIFALIFPLLASYFAYRRYKNASPQEVLRNE